MVFMVKAGSKSLSANGTGTISIDVSAGRVFRAKKVTFNSTGAFSITEIKDSAANFNYVAGELKSTTLKNKANANVFELDPPIEITGDSSLVFNLKDTSGSSNTIDIAVWGEEEPAR